MEGKGSFLGNLFTSALLFMVSPVLGLINFFLPSLAGSGGGIFSGIANLFKGIFSGSGPSGQGSAPESATQTASYQAPSADRAGNGWAASSLRSPFGEAADNNRQRPVVYSPTAGYDPAAARAAYGAADVRALDPQFQAPVERVMERLRAKGWDPVIASGLRTQEEQDEKVSGGFSAAKHSKHQDGLAVDIVQRGLGWKGEASDKSFQFWKDLQEAGEAEGLISGARWTKEKDGIEADVAHLQLPVGNSSGPRYASQSRKAPTATA